MDYIPGEAAFIVAIIRYIWNTPPDSICTIHINPSQPSRRLIIQKLPLRHPHCPPKLPNFYNHFLQSQILNHQINTICFPKCIPSFSQPSQNLPFLSSFCCSLDSSKIITHFFWQISKILNSDWLKLSTFANFATLKGLLSFSLFDHEKN